MKSFCIKTNNEEIRNYLLDRITAIDMDCIYLSCREFKIYQNIIVHYTGEDISCFQNHICDILVDVVLLFFEKMKLKEIINVNYFYFSASEKKNILEHCSSYLCDETSMEACIRKEHLYIALLKYITDSKSLVLEGFVNFRIKEYVKILDYIVDTSVNDFLIEREYNEFINLLKIYIDSKPCQTGVIHLIYTSGESILLDDAKNMIPVDTSVLTAKYLSDITFSSNDYALNSLLTLLPKKIIIHVIDKEDEFIQTLKLVFDTRVAICHHCSICTGYRMLEKNNGLLQ